MIVVIKEFLPWMSMWDHRPSFLLSWPFSAIRDTISLNIMVAVPPTWCFSVGGEDVLLEV
jgi:hypothetical protein